MGEKYCLIVYISLLLCGCRCLGSDCGIDPERRIDCYPEILPLPVSELECHQRGCCYNPLKGPYGKDGVPWCFYPSDYPSYVLTNFQETEYGYSGILKLENQTAKYPLKAVTTLKLEIYLETPERLHFKILDPSSDRYEVPIDTPKITKKTSKSRLYDVKITQAPSYFTLIVERNSNEVKVFDTSIAPLLFGDQFLQVSTKLASSDIYGLGERHSHLRADVYWQRIPFWAADHAPGFPQGGNLYGDHPFYLVVEPGGNSHGVFFLNSNAKEAELQPEPALTWRSIGGIMDFYIFMGPAPENVIQQYTETVGRPYMPPLWSLGYHLCRWGYKTANTTLDYVERMRKAEIPQDVQWNDIDYMDKKLDFTYDESAFDSLPSVVQNIHSHDQHYVMIIDPGISSIQPRGSYPPYDDGLASGIFINDTSGKNPVIGVVWPGKVSFPDFTNPSVVSYWTKQLASYYSKVPFDGVWIDMNEVSNFQDGSPAQCYKENSLDYPAYVPQLTGGQLFSKTICPSSRQYKTTNYNVHSLTGLLEMRATSQALISIRKKRPFVISRSTFPSAGLYGGHWTGDIKSTWEHMRLSIPGILGFNMFGIPLVGADICGFGSSTTEELCTRWSQLGAFYPFSRNHNDLAASAQAPVDFSSSTQKIIRDALRLRYSLIPYLYTLFHCASRNGSTVARPLFFEFPGDTDTYSVESQFMWGSGLLITPVLTEHSSSVEGYFPAGVWYDFYMKRGMKTVSKGQRINLSAPLAYIPVHVRGGSIIPGAFSGTVTSPQNPFFIVAAADINGCAKGSLFWDDGDSLSTYENGQYVLLGFEMAEDTLKISLMEGSSQILSTMHLEKVYVFGFSNPKNVQINGKQATFSLDENGQLIIDAKMMFEPNIVITWFSK